MQFIKGSNQYRLLAFLLILLAAVLIYQSDLISNLGSRKIEFYQAPFEIHDPYQAYFSGRSLPADGWTWSERRQSYFRQLLINGNFDTLVLPFQVDGKAIDLPARSLMTGYLIDALEFQKVVKAPSHYLVAKALGELSRQYSLPAVYRLANNMGVRRIIWGFTGHDSYWNMDITVKIQTASPDGRFDDTTSPPSLSLDGLPFSDLKLPSEVFLEKLTEVLEFITGDIETREVSGYANDRDIIPAKSPVDWVRADDRSILDQVAHYQWIGSLVPSFGNRLREVFFEKSLVKLQSLSRDCDECRIYRARAYAALYRRPAAIRALGTTGGEDWKAMFAYLNGNLNEMTRYIEGGADNFHTLITSINTADVEEEYEKPQVDRSDLLPPRMNSWAAIYERRLSDADVWRTDSNFLFLELLANDFGLYAPGDMSYLEMLEQYVFGELGRWTGGGWDFLNEQLFSKHASPVFDMNLHREFETYYFDRLINDLDGITSEENLRELDYFLLMDSIFTDNVFRVIEKRLNAQGLTEKALEKLEAIEPFYFGHRRHLFNKAIVLRTLAQSDANREENGRSDLYQQEGKKLMLLATYIDQTQSGSFPYTPYYLYKFDQSGADGLLTHDFPNRDYWWIKWNLSDRNYDEGNTYRNPRLNIADNKLNYTITDFGKLKSLYEKIVNEEEKPDLAFAMFEKHQHRFKGHAEMTHFVAKRMKHAGLIDKAVETYRDAIRDNPGILDNYKHITQLMIAVGQVDEAFSFIINSPLAKLKKDQAVVFSNTIFQLGKSFYLVGEVERAKELFEISAKTRTGSYQQKSAKMHLVLLNNNFSDAAKIAQNKWERYTPGKANTEYMTFKHILGRHDEADSQFELALRTQGKTFPWTALLVGHRMRGYSAAQDRKWLRDQSSLNRDRRYLAIHAIERLVMNRSVPDDIEELVSELQGDLGLHLDEEDNLLSSSNSYSGVVGPGLYKNNRTRPVEMLELESDLALYARALLAIQKGEYQAVFAMFEKYLQFYDMAKDKFMYSLPHFAWVAAKVGDTDELYAYLDNFRGDQKKSLYYLAKAILEAGKDNHQEAMRLLKRSVYADNYTDWASPMAKRFLIVDFSARLFEETSLVAYREFALQYARRFESVIPGQAWPFIFQYRYFENEKERARALRYIRYLDPEAEFFSQIPTATITETDQWLMGGNPYLRSTNLASPGLL